MWGRRVWECGACGRRGRRRRFYTGRGGGAVCRDEDLCWRHRRFMAAAAAMPAVEEEAAQARAQAAAKIAALLSEMRGGRETP